MKEPYHSLNKYLRAIFGQRVQKIPLDAGMTCPNRDGTVGSGGCIYCDAKGSGTGARRSGVDVAEQMRKGIAWAKKRYGARRVIAYFQSFSNTYAPLKTLEILYSKALVGPQVAGLAISTRPDCVDRDRLELITRVGSGRLTWMEYGLQSASDATLRKINRGHTVADFIKAVELTREFGLPVCAHVIFGLPGEGRTEMEQTVRLLADMKINGIKFHQLFVVKGTALHSLYVKRGYTPMEREEYVDLVAWALATLPAETIVQRLTGDPRSQDLVAPLWSLEKSRTIRMIRERLGTR